MKNFIIIFILALAAILIFCKSSYALDPDKSITQYIHRTWGLEDGLPQLTVLSLVQCRDGYLWIGTQEGLARFDGVRFKVFNRHNVKEFKSHYIDSLYEDDTGALWIGTKDGLSRYFQGRFTTWTEQDGLPSSRINALAGDSRGNLWIGTENGLTRRNHNDGSFRSYMAVDSGDGWEGPPNNFVRTIYLDRSGVLWIGTEGGLSRYNPADGTFKSYTTDQGLSSNRIQSIHEDRDGNFRVGTMGSGINLMDKKNDRFYREPALESLSTMSIWKIFQDSDGNLWIGTLENSLFRLNRHRLDSFTEKDGLSNIFIMSIIEDFEGNLWMGSGAGGLNFFRDGMFTAYTTREGLSHNIAITVAEGDNGSIWVGTLAGGLNRINPDTGNVTSDILRRLRLTNQVSSLYQGQDQKLWLGFSAGLASLNNTTGKFTRYDNWNIQRRKGVRAIYKDSDGALWIGKRSGGIYRQELHIENGNQEPTFVQMGLEGITVRVIHRDSNGILRAGTDNGLAVLKENSGSSEFTLLTTKDGLSGNYIKSIYEDEQGTVWIGTHGNGLNRLKNGEIKNITTKNGLFNNVIHQLLEDDSGFFWISCNVGIYKVSKQELNDFCENKIDRVNCMAFNESHGMKSRECNGGGPGGCKSSDGTLWFTTVKGVVKVDPQNPETKNTVLPPVWIENVAIEKKNFLPPFKDTLQIEAGTGRFEFHFTALSFSNPRSVYFKYMLEGLDPDWRESSTARTATYTSLEPGNYTFRVKACNNDGVWNEEGASVSFYLKPWFYQTRIFFALSVLAFLFMVWGIYRYRIRQLTRGKVELEKLVKERTRQLEESNRIAMKEREAAQKANLARGEFLARMSHEIRTPMNGIIGFTDILMQSGLNQEQEEWAGIISSSSKSLLRLLNDILDLSKIEAGKLTVHPVDFKPRQLMPDIIKIVRPLVKRKPLDIRYNVTDNVPKCVRGDDERIRQVLLNLIGNAIKFTAKGEVVATFDIKNHGKNNSGNDNSPILNNTFLAHITVKDTGIGIPDEKLETIFHSYDQASGGINREYGGTGLGLPICKQIAAIMGGDVWVESVPGEGSTFHFTARLEEAEETKTQNESKPDVTAEARETQQEKPFNILLAEDNPVNRKLATYILTKAGFSVTVAEDGAKAVNLYTSEPENFDLIFMDIQMPNMDGLEATRRIRGFEKNGDTVPIIAMTAQSMKGDRERCLEVGMNDYVSKPIKKHIVLNVTKKWSNRC